jgi:hypothetical protein
VLGWIGLSLGLLIIVLQIPAVGHQATRPWRSLKRSRVVKRTLGARYRQHLRCNTCGHEFYEVVMNTRRGWLEREGAERKCPSCGSGLGFQSIGSEPLNRAAKKLGSL